MFGIIQLKEKERKQDSIEHKELSPEKLKEIKADDQSVNDVQLSPDGRYITYQLVKHPEGEKNTIVPDYVTASGYTEDIPNRTKVGAPQETAVSYIFDRQRDSIYQLLTSSIPGIKDIPEYFKDYPKELEERKKLNADRQVFTDGPYWSGDGKNAVVVVTARDNKDKWIMKLDAATGNLSLLYREHNDAWVGGPGAYNFGWTDNMHFYFESEASGYAHIYTVDVTDRTTKQLTSGKWEVQTLQLSNDKKTFYFTANYGAAGYNQFLPRPG